MINARSLAYQILLHIEQKASHPDRLIRAVLERHSRLDERDKALMTELVYGVLRRQGGLDWHIDQLSKIDPRKIDPSVRILLRLALYQILFLERVPAHAAVNETVNLAKAAQPPHVVGFVNGILREAIRLNGKWNWPSMEKHGERFLAVSASHPEWAVRSFIKELGFEECRELCDANNTVAPLTLRVNTLKARPLEVLQGLEVESIQAESSPWIDGAFRVFGIRQDVSRLSVFRDGWVQVQDEASQIVSLLVSPKPGDRVLDLCAGFGAKATHLAALMENSGEILSVDLSAWKLEELRNNARRQAIDIITTAANDVLDLKIEECGIFDRVLLDAPCSGFGTLRRNPDIKWRRHPKDPYRFSRLQMKLLDHASEFVSQGGSLVYATCTLFREENEDVAKHFTDTHPGWVTEQAADLLPTSCKVLTEGPFLRTWPHRHGIDGFFGAVWRKEAST